MTINANLTVQRHSKNAVEKTDLTTAHEKAAYELGWTQSSFASILNWIEIRYGEAELLDILGKVGINPVHMND